MEWPHWCPSNSAALRKICLPRDGDGCTARKPKQGREPRIWAAVRAGALSRLRTTGPPQPRCLGSATLVFLSARKDVLLKIREAAGLTEWRRNRCSRPPARRPRVTPDGLRSPPVPGARLSRPHQPPATSSGCSCGSPPPTRVAPTRARTPAPAPGPGSSGSSAAGRTEKRG